MTSFTHRLIAAAACAALALPVLAQTSPATATPSDGTTSMQTHRGQNVDRQAKRQQWQEKRAERQANRMAKFKEQLAITPAQEPAWARFTESMHAKRDFARPDRTGMDKLTTPERIDRMRAMRAQRNAAMDVRMDAAKAFYSELQPEQQRTFDTASARMMHMGAPGGKHHRHGRKGEGKHMRGQHAAGVQQAN